MQAIGRARGVNRTAENPVEIIVMNDLCLPLTVDTVVQWVDVPADLGVEMAVDGIVLASPSDMAACRPFTWPTGGQARQWLKRGTRGQSPVQDTLYRKMTPCSARYQRTGPKQRWRACRFNPDVIPDPRAWLEARLGELRVFEIVGRADAETDSGEGVSPPGAASGSAFREAS